MPTHRAAREPAARIVRECGDEAVGIFQCQRSAVGIVGGDAAHVSEGVADLGAITLRIVAESREVADVGARTVPRIEQSLGVVAVRWSCVNGRLAYRSR